MSTEDGPKLKMQKVQKDVEVDLELGKKLVSLAEKVGKFAAPPVSGFHVGAVAVGESGTLYGGVNVELPGQPLQQTIHAEHFCMASAIANGLEKGLVAVGVTAAPCGHCRQMLVEIASEKGIKVYLRNKSGEVEEFDLENDLLRVSVKADLLDESNTHASNGVNSKSLKVRCDQPNSQVPEQELISAFLKANTPYSGCKSACSFKLASGEVVTGSALESVAFNPGVPPFQSCLIKLAADQLGVVAPNLDFEKFEENLKGKENWDLFQFAKKSIRQVCLVQEGKEGRLISHKHTIAGIVDDILPQAEFVACEVEQSK